MQSAEAKAAEQCAADYAELAEARKKIDFLQKQGKVLDSKSPKSRQGRGKGKHLGHVYDGDYLRRDGHPDNAEAGAARCEKCKEAEEKAQAQTQVQTPSTTSLEFVLCIQHGMKAEQCWSVVRTRSLYIVPYLLVRLQCAADCS